MCAQVLRSRRARTQSHLARDYFEAFTLHGYAVIGFSCLFILIQILTYTWYLFKTLIAVT